jgi:hypothetical protein
MYRTATGAVDSHGKKGKKDRYSGKRGKRTRKETGQKWTNITWKKVDKHHLEYKGKTSLRPLPLSIGRFKSQVSVKSMGPIWIFNDLVAFARS